jgi:hypothetical protein
MAVLLSVFPAQMFEMRKEYKDFLCFKHLKHEFHLHNT